MTSHGQRPVDAAKADGRWDAAYAYAPIRSVAETTVPADLRAAIDANPHARKTFPTLGRYNLFALAFRTNTMKTPIGRAKKIATLVDMLARGETIVPERRVPARNGADCDAGLPRMVELGPVAHQPRRNAHGPARCDRGRTPRHAGESHEIRAQRRGGQVHNSRSTPTASVGGDR